MLDSDAFPNLPPAIKALIEAREDYDGVEIEEGKKSALIRAMAKNPDLVDFNAYSPTKENPFAAFGFSSDGGVEVNNSDPFGGFSI